MVICGGKSGVGKTTTSASLTFAMASAGHDVAVASMDPAHSLGDALDADLRGGSLVSTCRCVVRSPSHRDAREEEGARPGRGR